MSWNGMGGNGRKEEQGNSQFMMPCTRKGEIRLNYNTSFSVP